jgi:murein L,D-transpeptidase YcbB/YkuD
MAGKKRLSDNSHIRAAKKIKRKQQAYHSDSDGPEEAAEFDAVNLLDSDDDIHNAVVDDVQAPNADSSDSESEAEKPVSKKPKTTKKRESAKRDEPAQAEDNAPLGDDDDDDEDEEEEDDNDEFDLGSDVDDDDEEASEDGAKRKNTKSKRNDPSAFATSMSKILSTKLSSSKRADPVLARSAAAHEASRAAVDQALEHKAKKQLREQKKKALERGRVKDVLIASRNEVTGEAETTTAEILETERRLRKVAQRGVVRLFNAVRAAQVKALEAEKGTRKDGVIGMGRREEKVNEMSKKGFLELIASGGGGLKKGALEEA